MRIDVIGLVSCIVVRLSKISLICKFLVFSLIKSRIIDLKEG